MYHKICLCFGIGIEFEIMSVATDKASFRVIELQGQVVILRKCFHPLHLISILHATVVIQNKMIVVGGGSGSGLLDDVQIYEREIVGSSYKLRSIQFSEKALLRFHIYIHILELVTFYFCKNLPEYPSKQHLEGRLLLAIHEANEGFGFGLIWSFDTYTECWSPMEAKVES
ncbi:E3 ubiquitin-protein ligase UPL2 [Glycine max]|nr:E3 ubiquitin-protein ligase UPL2 [Glycine max]